MNDLGKQMVLWLIVAIVIVMLFQNFTDSQNSPTEISYSQLITDIRNGSVREVTVLGGRNVEGKFSSGATFKSVIPLYGESLEELARDKPNFDLKGKVQENSLFMAFLMSWGPMLLLIGVWIFFMRQMQGGGGKGAMSFGKSKARLLGEDQVTTTFADVAGVEEAKEDVVELVEFLRDPGKFQKLGGKLPRGVLMVGQPGTGKTLLAKAIAGEAKVPFFTISGSDFVEMFVGVGASRVRDMFDQAKKHAPCIIFID